ncbi:bifunctional 3-phosphoshikimate 1-carboxyvinyltransferase/cytidylate kinase [Aquabacterium sp. J223]|nr:bifunctional 3-phosphoshikimate 1-carboxyvinyltransferase/cytidylate kinase [Aquabacterium sp. J223]
MQLPGSKSISNRALLLAAFADGRTRLHDLLESDDTQVMLDALRTLGCEVVREAGGTVAVSGLGGRLAVREGRIFLGNSGTSARSLTAALALLASAQGGRFELYGVPRMHERPIGDLVNALRPLGCAIRDLGQPGFPPLELGDGRPHSLSLRAPIRVRGDVSSQFLTGLLLSLPLVSTDHDIVVEVDGELISKPYIAITLDFLRRFGVEVREEGWQRFTLPAGSRLRSPGEVHVEGDASSASYFVALGALAADAHDPVVIRGIGRRSIQGDVRFLDAAAAMGAAVGLHDHHVEVHRGAWPLKAVTLDCNHIPDAAMTLAVMALYADGTTRLTNIGSWRVKETDRIAAMATELRKLGAAVDEGADWIAVTPPAQWRRAAIHTYDDHRVAMCLSLAAFNGLGGRSPGLPVRILDPRCVAKTFPDYFETLFGLARANTADIPVITIDGPTASGKGTLASAVAAALGWHTLDSGSLYRVTALAALRAGVAADDPSGLAAVARGLSLRFAGTRLWLDGEDVTDRLRDEAVGSLASRISAYPPVRQALNDLQLGHRRLPGLVADGRDMGTVIFPDAPLKVFLTASAAQRAERRHRQLLDKGQAARIADLRADLEARDERDRNRTVAPLKPAEDAVLLDNSAQTIEESVATVLGWWAQRNPF